MRCGKSRSLKRPARVTAASIVVHGCTTIVRIEEIAQVKVFPTVRLGAFRPLRIVQAALAVAAIAAAIPGAASAQGVSKGMHGDWETRCDKPPGAQGEICSMMQFVTAEDRDNVGLSVIVLKTADKKSKVMRVLAPLGVLLPSGLGLKIDQNEMGRAGFVRCLPDGCLAEVILDDDLIGKLRNGKTATFVIFQTPEEGIGIPISLTGFGPGFDALP
jgi:invasion protein IalB